MPDPNDPYNDRDEDWRKETAGYIPAWLKTCEHTDEALARTFWWYASRKAEEERARIMEILERHVDDVRYVYRDMCREIEGRDHENPGH